MAESIDKEEMRKKLLADPKKIISMAKSMDANVEAAQEIFNELERGPLPVKEWFEKFDKMMDLIVYSIINALRSEFMEEGLGEFDLEKHFLRAMLDLKKCTPESLRQAEVSILKARMEGKKLEKIKREALEATLEIGAILKHSKVGENNWSLRSEFIKLEDSVDSILLALDEGKYELALFISRSALKKANELRELKLTSLRFAAKAGHIVAKVKSEEHSSLPRGSFTRLNTFLSTIKYLLEEGDYQTARVLAKGVKHEAEILLPPERTGTVTFVCPICFDTKCPNEHCKRSISPSPLVHETCRTYCICGTYYHICCVQKGENLICINCRKPLKG